MKPIITLLAAVIALALGVVLGVRWAHYEENRWIVSGERLPY